MKAWIWECVTSAGWRLGFVAALLVGLIVLYLLTLVAAQPGWFLER